MPHQSDACSMDLETKRKHIRSRCETNWDIWTESRMMLTATINTIPDTSTVLVLPYLVQDKDLGYRKMYGISYSTRQETYTSN